MIAGIQTVLQAAGDRNTLLVDARAPERFDGRAEPLDRVAGHIPGAVNRFFKRNVDAQGTLRTSDALRADFAELLGGKSPQDAIMYCGSGVTACHNLLALEHAGLPGARLYPGSWSEWCSDPARPTATGPS
jgi:thiosulfate/3-mercaptopyruvate sulfurtransferase